VSHFLQPCVLPLQLLPWQWRWHWHSLQLLQPTQLAGPAWSVHQQLQASFGRLAEVGVGVVKVGPLHQEGLAEGLTRLRRRQNAEHSEHRLHDSN
jgi:hypothetical protein